MYLRTHRLPGSQHEWRRDPCHLRCIVRLRVRRPNAAGSLRARLGGRHNRQPHLSYVGHGDDGVLQILNGKSCFRPPTGTSSATRTTRPMRDLESPQTSILYMSPDQGGRTAAARCSGGARGLRELHRVQDARHRAARLRMDGRSVHEAPHWSFVVDVTVENSKDACAGNPGQQMQQNLWQGPMVLSTMWVDPRAGENAGAATTARAERASGRTRARELPRSVLRQAYVPRLFHGWRAGRTSVEPQGPVEVSSMCRVSNALTEPAGYMTNNLEVDDAGISLRSTATGTGWIFWSCAARREGSALGGIKVTRATMTRMTTTTTTREAGVKTDSTIGDRRGRPSGRPFFWEGSAHARASGRAW